MVLSEKCECCGTTNNVTLAPHPYAQEIYDDDTEVWMCDSCRENARDDI